MASPGNGMDPGLDALVRLCAAVAAGVEEPLEPHLTRARDRAAAREVEEALLQSYLFVGYPLALTALGAWRELTGRQAPDPAGGGWEEWGERGEETCRTVYGRAYPALRHNIGRLSPELDVWMVTEGYGKVLGRPEMALWRRECCVVAILAVLGTEPQLRSHLRGALRTGTPPATVDRVLDAALELAPEERRPAAREAWAQVLRRWEDA